MPAWPQGIAEAARTWAIMAAWSRHSARRSPPSCRLLSRDGGFVAPGYASALDEQRSLRDESRS